MAEYIEREAAVSEIAKLSNKSDMPVYWHKGMSVAMSAVCRIPAADVAPVVRCKDCIHSHILGKGTSDPVRECRIHRYIYGENRWVNEGDFCAWGRQKENKDGDGDV